MGQVVVGTAGHIDHGKTSLVAQLTGTNTDRLIEEKERGMTIDLGFAYLNESITIIDVPGHEKFIRNMAAGAANIHFGLIVIAADDGVMPQTREHLDILTLLGVKQGLVIITKIDLVQDKDWIDLVEMDIRDLLDEKGFEANAFHRVNNITGDGISDLKQDILSLSNTVQSNSLKSKFRMNVDRVFSKTGFGTIVTGTVMNGTISIAEDVECFPNNIISKVRGIQTHGGETSSASKGDRAALNLANIKSSQLTRGSVVATPNCIQNTLRIIAHIQVTNSTDWILKNKQRVRLHFGTTEILGRLIGGTLEKGQAGNYIIELETPVAVAMDDMFVVRSYSPMETIAGGRVIDTNPRGKLSDIKSKTLEMPVDSRERFYFSVLEDWTSPKTIQEWADYYFRPNQLIQDWVNSHLALSSNHLVYHPSKLDEGMNVVEKFFLSSYENNPFRTTLSSEIISSSLKWSSDWLMFVAQKMVELGIIMEGGTGYSLTEHTPTFSNKDLKDLSHLESIVTRTQYEPILTKEIVERSGLQPKRAGDLIHLLYEQKKIENLGNNFWLKQDVLKSVIKQINIFFKSNKTLAISDFKELTGLSRKTAIPLLEYLDKNHYTIREENVRMKGESIDDE